MRIREFGARNNQTEFIKLIASSASTVLVRRMYAGLNLVSFSHEIIFRTTNKCYRRERDYGDGRLTDISPINRSQSGWEDRRNITASSRVTPVSQIIPSRYIDRSECSIIAVK